MYIIPKKDRYNLDNVDVCILFLRRIDITWIMLMYIIPTKDRYNLDNVDVCILFLRRIDITWIMLMYVYYSYEG